MSESARGLRSALSSCALADQEAAGRLLGTGRDLLDLLHRLSTADLRALGPGSGCPAVLTSPKGRIVEALSVHHLGVRGVLLLCGAGGAGRVLAHLKKYTFAEDTGLRDATQETVRLVLLGPAFEAAARGAGLPALPPYGAAEALVAGASVWAARTNGFDDRGVTVIAPRSAAEGIREALAAAAAAEGGGSADDAAMEAWRILSGFPASGRELTEEHNPLEAGLAASVSFTKGCYVGQEVVARLNTYDKVARRLVRLEIGGAADPPAPGSPVLLDGREIGRVTSAARIPGRDAAAALAYVRRRDLPEGASAAEVDGPGGARPARLLSD